MAHTAVIAHIYASEYGANSLEYMILTDSEARSSMLAIRVRIFTARKIISPIPAKFIPLKYVSVAALCYSHLICMMYRKNQKKKLSLQDSLCITF